MASSNQIFPDINNCIICVVGLGYVGLPLAVEFSKLKTESSGEKKKRSVVGFDINKTRINELLNGLDRTNEVSKTELTSVSSLIFTSDISLIEKSDIFIITVPTPVDDSNLPNLEPLKNATKMIGKVLHERNKSNALYNYKNPIVIFESTVYPGATEEVCVPILEKYSGLKLNQYDKNGFFIGYSPERINPGDKNNNLKNIMKVTSGSNKEVGEWIDQLYKKIIVAGTHLAPNIKVAEASKIIENTQRDINIALINEFSIIFHKLGIDTLDIIEAASTKWNFLKFKPGLVGGHCIGVDPYYLAYKAKQTGYYPHIVLAGRRINDGMGEWIVQQLVLELAKKGKCIGGSNVLVLGFTFKENTPDIRNTKVVKMIEYLEKYNINPSIHDPIANKEEVKAEYNIELLKEIPEEKHYSAVIVALSHSLYLNWKEENWRRFTINGGIIFDIKGIVPRSINPIRL